MAKHTFTSKAWISKWSSVGQEDLQKGERLGDLQIQSMDMTDVGYTLVGEVTVTIDVPGVADLVAAKVAAVDGEIKKLRADFYSAEAGLLTQKQNLLALTNEVAA